MRLSETGEGEGWPTAGPALAGRERDLAQLWPGVRADLCLARDIFLVGKHKHSVVPFDSSDH